jgi:hypothetical protein
MNNFRGYTTINLGGKIRPIKFGANQTILFCQLRKCNLKDYTELFKKEKLDAYDLDGSESRDLIWSALKDGARYQKEEFDFLPEDIGDWLDDSNDGEVKKMFEDLVLPTIKEDKKKVSKRK